MYILQCTGGVYSTCTYKLFLICIAKEILFALGAQQPRLSRPNFHVYIEQLTEGMKLREFEEFSEYLMTSVKVGSPISLTI